MSTAHELRLGLRVNLAQFSLLGVVNALVAGMVGQEQDLLPLLAKQEVAVAVKHPVPDGSQSERPPYGCRMSSRI